MRATVCVADCGGGVGVQPTPCAVRPAEALDLVCAADRGRDVGAHGSAVSAFYGVQARLGLHPRSFARLVRRDLANAALTKGTGERTYGLRRLIPNIPQSMVILAVSMAYIDQSGTFR